MRNSLPDLEHQEETSQTHLMRAMLTQPHLEPPIARGTSRQNDFDPGKHRVLTLFDALTLELLFRRWRLIAISTVLFGLLTSIYSIIKSDRYEAIAVVLVGSRSDQTDVITARGDVETYRVRLSQLAAKNARTRCRNSGQRRNKFRARVASTATRSCHRLHS